MKTFVDTSILGYAHDLTETFKHPVAQRALARLWTAGTGVLSIQVLDEFYLVATRTFSPPMSPREARTVIADYASWQVVAPDAAMLLDASVLEEEHSVSFRDALVIEAARRAGAGTLLTEDLPHGRRFGALTVENPLTR